MNHTSLTRLSSGLTGKFLPALAVAVLSFQSVNSTIAAITDPGSIEIEAKLSINTAGAATLDPDLPNGTRLPTSDELAVALRDAIADPAGVSSSTGLKADVLTTSAVKFNPNAAPILAGAAVTEVYNGGVDGAVNNKTKFDKANKLGAKVVAAALLNANLTSKTDPASAAAAITSEIVCALNDNQVILGTSFYKKALKKAVTSAVGAVKSNTGNILTKINVPTDGAIRVKMDDDDNVLDTKAQAYEAAGAVTGAVTQLQKVGNFDNNALVAAVVTSAAKAAPARYLEIAQAAATAGAFVYGSAINFDNGGGDTLIANAIKKANPTAWQKRKTKVQQAVAFGMAEAALALSSIPGHLGAGAAGVANYAYNNCTGTPVTDIGGF